MKIWCASGSACRSRRTHSLDFLSAVFSLLTSYVGFDWLETTLDHIFLALDSWRLVDSSLLLDHLAASFEDAALLDHQRRRLDVAVQFARATELDTLAGNDV